MSKSESLRFLATALLLLLLLSAPVAAQSPSDVFSVVLLPDTQYYSASHPNIFNSQTQWIVNNKVARNIQMVIGEGDIVDNADLPAQWANADAAVKILDGQIPYTLAIGNHDYDGLLPQNRGVTAFNQHFGPSRYIAYPWYGGNFNNSNENFYTFFNVNGQAYMVLALEFFPRDSVLTWASSVIDSHPEAQVMVVTHSFLFTDGTRGDQCDTNDMSGQVAAHTANNPEGAWQKLLGQKPNVTLIVSGHLIGDNTAHRTDLGVNGNVVNQIFTNFQNITNGGNGYLRILTFHPSENRIDVTTYSPFLNSFLTTAAHQFSMPITNQGNTATTGSIAGKVRTPACAPIAGAEVSTAGETADTDSNGLYILDGLSPNGPGGYTVSVQESGFVSQTLPGTANNGFTDQQDFYLLPVNTAPCTLSTIDPSVTFCTPTANAAVTSPIHVVAGATSSKAVSYMQLYLDGVKQFQVSAKTLDTTVAAGAGTHKVTVQFKDSSGLITKNSISVTVGSALPPPPPPGTTVTITSPAAGATVTSPVHVAATVTSSRTISLTQVYVDGVAKYTVKGNVVSTYIPMAAGAHRLTVQAKDSAGVITKQTENITVH